MDRFGNWFTLGLDHLRDNWQQHIVPALVFFGVLMGLAVVFSVLALGAMFGLMALIVAPLQVGYMRGVLKSMRGQGELTAGDLFSGFSRTPSAVIVLLITVFGGGIAFLFFVFPAYLLAALFFHAMPAVADKGLGPIAAIQESIRLVKPNFWPMVLYVVIYGMALGFVAYIPLIGPLVMFPMMIIFAVAPYLDAQEEADGAAPADMDQWQDEQFGSV